MHNISFSRENNFLIANHFLTGTFELQPGKVTMLAGENGIGKSSLIKFLKGSQSIYFPNCACRFIDQLRLTPLNDVSYQDIKKTLVPYRHENLNIYDTLESDCEDFICKPIRLLSGGQNQMIKILIATFLGGDIFFLDEPFQFLDSNNQKRLYEIIEFLKSEGKSLCIIEHNEKSIADLVDNTYRLVKKDKDIQIQEVLHG